MLHGPLWDGPGTTLHMDTAAITISVIAIVIVAMIALREFRHE